MALDFFAFFSGSIYLISIPLLVIYFLLEKLRKVFPRYKRIPNPANAVAVCFVLSIFTLPSLPRYQFERDTLLKIDQAKHLKLLSSNQAGSLTEPLTWFRAPIYSVYLAGPKLGTESSFQTVRETYKQETEFGIVDAECGEMLISYSYADSKGTFRYVIQNETMSEIEYQDFCEEDYSLQKQLLLDN